jgi:hypothetical protein
MDSGRRWRDSDTFRVVGICANGRREVVWRHVSRSLAERVRQMLQETDRYDDVSLESESGASALAGPANRRAS